MIGHLGPDGPSAIGRGCERTKRVHGRVHGTKGRKSVCGKDGVAAIAEHVATFLAFLPFGSVREWASNRDHHYSSKSNTSLPSVLEPDLKSALQGKKEKYEYEMLGARNNQLLDVVITLDRSSGYKTVSCRPPELIFMFALSVMTRHWQMHSLQPSITKQ